MHPPPAFRGPFRTDDTARALYAEGAGVFRIVPAAVAVPSDVDDLVALVRWAADTETPLVPRGAGSGMAGHNVGPGVVVDLTRGFRSAPVVDPERRVARAGAGVVYRDLNAAAALFGLRLPPDPSSGAFCTLGGMVACNAAGAHTLKYGAVRRWVRGVEWVSGDGEIGGHGATEARRLGAMAAERRFAREAAPFIEQQRAAIAAAAPRVRKNSSGYDLLPPAGGDWMTNLLVGSEGTLGILTAVEVALAPVPARTATLLAVLPSLDDAPAAIAALEPFAPAAVELLDRTYLDFVRGAVHGRIPAGAEALLLVELEDDGRDAAAAARRVAAEVLHADDPAEVAALWAIRHLASPRLASLPDGRRSLQVVEDGCVPLPALGAYIRGLRAAALRHGFEIVIFGHAGDGHVHANLIADVTRADLAARLGALLAEVSALQADLGGTVAGEHGDGRLRAPFLARLHGPVALEAMRHVKRAFDPAGILNPGVKFDAPPLTADQLKVGPGAPPIPGGIAALLRTVEKDAAWATFRLDLRP
jgi:FAD/FMN-containing dehydrogenase